MAVQVVPMAQPVTSVNAVQRYMSGPSGQSITVAPNPMPNSMQVRQAAFGSVSAPTQMVAAPTQMMPRQGSVVLPRPEMQVDYGFASGGHSQSILCATPPPPMGWPSAPSSMGNRVMSQPSLSVAETPQPQALTQGLPDPKQIESQRGAYMKGLDSQLKEGADVLNQQLKQQQEYLLRMGDQQKRQYGLQVDQDIKAKELELVQQHNHQLLMLQQAAQQQKVALEQQANALLIEYNQKKATEDLTSQMFHFENEAREAHKAYTTEIHGLQTQMGLGAQQLAAQGEALAWQANLSNMQAIQAQQVASRTSASLTAPMPQSVVGPASPHPMSYMQPVSHVMTPPPSYLPPVQPGLPPSHAMVPTMGAFPRSASRTGGAPMPFQQSGALTPRASMAMTQGSLVAMHQGNRR